MVNTRKYKKTKGGWPWSTSPELVQVDQNDCTVIANKSIGDIDEINLDNLETLAKQRNKCKVSNQSLKFTVDDTTIEGLIAKKKQINDQHKELAQVRAAEDAAKTQLANAKNHIAEQRKNEFEKEEKEYNDCKQKNLEDKKPPDTCPGYDRFNYLDKKHGGNRRTKRKHKKFKKAKSKRRSIKRRMNK